MSLKGVQERSHCSNNAIEGHARLKFARDNQDKDLTFWKHVLWSDETKIDLFGHNDQSYGWRKEGEAFHPNKTSLQSRIDAAIVPLTQHF